MNRWSHLLVVVGLVAMLLGVVDPLEGSVVILAGAAMAALGEIVGHGRHRRFLCLSLFLIALGVAAMVSLSAIGGIGGHTGRSNAWGLVLVPYPVGWIMGLVGAIRMIRERGRPPAVA